MGLPGRLRAVVQPVAVAYTAALTFLLVHPDAFALLGWGAKSVESQVDASIPGFFQHLSAYVLLGMLLQAGFVGPHCPAWCLFVLTVLHGVATESIQALVPHRTADAADLLADISGALIALGVCWRLQRNSGWRPDVPEPAPVASPVRSTTAAVVGTKSSALTPRPADVP
ncbi:MAG: VanZ family protein [Planctomycetaceae bacterium]